MAARRAAGGSRFVKGEAFGLVHFQPGVCGVRHCAPFWLTVLQLDIERLLVAELATALRLAVEGLAIPMRGSCSC